MVKFSEKKITVNTFNVRDKLVLGGRNRFRGGGRRRRYNIDSYMANIEIVLGGRNRSKLKAKGQIT